RLCELDVVAAARLLLDLDALVVVVDRDRQLLLRALLADDVLVEELLDLLGRRERGPRAAVLEPVVVGDDVVADLDALVADEDGRTRDELPDVVLVLVTERAPQDLGLARLFHHASALLVSSWPLSGPFADDIINNTVFFALVGRHDVIALRVLLDTFLGLSRVVHEDAVDPLPHPQDFTSRNINIGCLPPQPRPEGLVDDNPCIRERETLLPGARRHQDLA